MSAHRKTGKPRGVAHLPVARRVENARRAGQARARRAGWGSRSRLAQMRYEAKLTLAQVADHLGVSRQYVSRVERCRTTGMRMPEWWVKRLADLYGVTWTRVREAALVHEAA